MQFIRFGTALKIAAALLISIVVSIIAANRSDITKDRNDTIAYETHHYCVLTGKTVDQCRNEIGGTPFEFLYEQFIYFLTKIFSVDNFFQIKLAVAIAIYATILCSIAISSGNFALSVIILLLDFRFWEYGSNVLRHGFAAAFIVAGSAFYSTNKTKFYILSKLLSVVSHLSAIVVAYTPKTKYKKKTLMIFSTIVLAIILTSEYWISAVLESNLFDYKIDYYIRNSDGYDFSFPMHYAAIIFSGALIYNNTSSRRFIITFNYLIPLFFVAIVLGYLGASYRMASFMLPLLAVNIPDQIDVISKKFKEKEQAKAICIGLVSTMLAIIAFKNWDFFVIHLS